MRAIGKGSLASLLAIGLHFTRIILWIAFFGLTIAMLTVPFIPAILDLFQSSDSINVDVDTDDIESAGEFIEVAYYFVTVAVMLFVVNRLLEILKTLRFGSPFVKENADRFRSVGYALLLGELAKFAFGFLTLFVDDNVDINSSMFSWLAIIAVFVLSEVFHEGSRMKEEQDLTV
ncbi:MAG: hypothetical protein DHS20C05_22230 [Hyphococcus sp.]|nr:MAG: hypothetical protein DHS20C05_22230 [Marinicaulis sp.]